MPLKKQTFNADEIEIYDEAVVYKRGEYWQMRMWLGKEKKYALFPKWQQVLLLKQVQQQSSLTLNLIRLRHRTATDAQN
jgi:hypothetical protein